MTKNKQTQQNISDRCGCAWEQVIEWLGGKSVEEIKKELDYCWPQDDNDQFAKEIYEAVNEQK